MVFFFTSASIAIDFTTSINLIAASAPRTSSRLDLLLRFLIAAIASEAPSASIIFFVTLLVLEAWDKVAGAGTFLAGVSSIISRIPGASLPKTSFKVDFSVAGVPSGWSRDSHSRAFCKNSRALGPNAAYSVELMLKGFSSAPPLLNEVLCACSTILGVSVSAGTARSEISNVVGRVIAGLLEITFSLLVISVDVSATLVFGTSGTNTLVSVILLAPSNVN